jgi:hypothetical protein
MSDARDGTPRPENALARAEHVVELASGRRIEAAEIEGGELVRIRAKDGACVLTVELTDAGPILRFEGAALEIVAPRSLDIACGALRIEATEGATIAGKQVEIEAKRGGVTVRATDDVRVDGERVLLNSTDPPMPLSWDEYLRRQKEREGEALPAPPLPALPPGEGGQRDS